MTIVDLKLIFVVVCILAMCYQTNVNCFGDDFTAFASHKYNIGRSELYEFVTMPELVDRWMNWLPFFMAADFKPLSIGKHFMIFSNEYEYLLKVTDHKEGKYLALESADLLVRPRIEFLFNVSSSGGDEHSELEIRLTFRRTSALFQYEYRIEELQRIQQTLTFIKPEREWNYSNTWQHIGDPFYRQQIYSAYFDPRTQLFKPEDFDANHIFYGSIRIFAILPLLLQGQVICSIRYEDTFTEQVPAYEALPMHEHFNMKFSAYTIMCPLRVRRGGAIVHLPESVAIIYTANPLSHEVPTYVPISYSKANVLTKPTKMLAVCIGPLQMHYSQVLRMVEFIEIYRLLGAEKFYFYRLDVNAEIDAVLDYYQRAKLAEVNEWNFYGYAFEADVRYAGIMVEFNECVYRATFVDGYRYVAVVDLDEILVPLKYNTLLDYLRVAEDGRTSAFVFRNVFFFKKGANDTNSMPTGVRNRFLYTQVKVQRTALSLPPHDRSKTIVNGWAAIEVGNHQMWRSLEGSSETNVHFRDGLLFHYREKCKKCKADPLIVDFTARRFGSILWDQVDEVCGQVFPDGYCPMG